MTADGRAPVVAGLGDQRRRERRLIQKAPADSATRTPIHPAKRSSEDRSIVSGSSIDDEVPATVRGRTGGDALVLDTNWYPNRNDENGEVWVELDATETVARRRTWYRAVVDWRVLVDRTRDPPSRSSIPAWASYQRGLDRPARAPPRRTSVSS